MTYTILPRNKQGQRTGYTRQAVMLVSPALDITLLEREHQAVSHLYDLPSTPVALVRNVTRPDEAISLTTFAEVDPSAVDMFTLVLVGNSQSFHGAEHIVTPRGYVIALAEEVQS